MRVCKRVRTVPWAIAAAVAENTLKLSSSGAVGDKASLIAASATPPGNAAGSAGSVGDVGSRACAGGGGSGGGCCVIGVGRGICVRKSMRNAAAGGTRPSAFSSASPSSPATPPATAAAATVDMSEYGPDGAALFLGLITGLARGLRRGIRPLSPLPRPLLPPLLAPLPLPPLLLPPLLPLPLLWLPVLVLERLWWLRSDAMDNVRSWATSTPPPPIRRAAPLSPAAPCAH